MYYIQCTVYSVHTHSMYTLYKIYAINITYMYTL